MYLGGLVKKKERTIRVCDCPGAPDTEATLTIRLLSPGERRDVFGEAFKTLLIADDNGDAKTEVSIDERQAKKKLFNLSVKAWDGFWEDEDGKKKLPLTPSNKAKLIDALPEIIDFVSDEHSKLVDEVEARKEEEVKN